MVMSSFFCHEHVSTSVIKFIIVVSDNSFETFSFVPKLASGSIFVFRHKQVASVSVGRPVLDAACEKYSS